MRAGPARARLCHTSKMAKARGKRRKRGGGGGRRGRGGGGVMMGMRGGFKNLADSVTGSGERSRKSKWLGTALTVALVIAAAALLLSR
jgi:hypothetical protein